MRTVSGPDIFIAAAREIICGGYGRRRLIKHTSTQVGENVKSRVYFRYFLFWFYYFSSLGATGTHSYRVILLSLPPPLGRRLSSTVDTCNCSTVRGARYVSDYYNPFFLSPPHTRDVHLGRASWRITHRDDRPRSAAVGRAGRGDGVMFPVLMVHRRAAAAGGPEHAESGFYRHIWTGFLIVH